MYYVVDVSKKNNYNVLFQINLCFAQCSSTFLNEETTNLVLITFLLQVGTNWNLKLGTLNYLKKKNFKCFLFLTILTIYLPYFFSLFFILENTCKQKTHCYYIVVLKSYIIIDDLFVIIKKYYK